MSLPIPLIKEALHDALSHRQKCLDFEKQMRNPSDHTIREHRSKVQQYQRLLEALEWIS